MQFSASCPKTIARTWYLLLSPGLVLSQGPIKQAAPPSCPEHSSIPSVCKADEASSIKSLVPSVLVPQIETAQDAGNILVPGSLRQPISCYTTMPCPSFQAPGKAWPLRREPELGMWSHLEELGGRCLQQETPPSVGTSACPHYAPSLELGFVSSLGCWPHALIPGGFYLNQDQGGKWGKQSEPEAQEGSESESREWSFHLSRVFAAGASLASSSIVPEWQPGRHGPSRHFLKEQKWMF